MDFDIRKHGFYLGLAGALVLYIILYIVLIPNKKAYQLPFNKLSGQNQEVSDLLAQKNLPSDELIQYHQDLQIKLQNHIQAVNNTFKKKDEHLEQWFDEIAQNMKVQNLSEPKLDDFQTMYSYKRNRLVETYASKTEGLLLTKASGLTFDDPKTRKNNIQNEILPPELNNNPLSNQDLIKRAQKQFWMVEKMLLVIEKGKMKKLNSYRFIGNWEDTNARTFFIRRKIELVGQMEYGDISYFLQEVLNNQYFLTEITKLSIRRDNTYRPDVIKLDVRYDQTDEKVLEEYMRKNVSKGKFPLVEITVHIDIFDYQDYILQSQLTAK